MRYRNMRVGSGDSSWSGVEIALNVNYGIDFRLLYALRFQLKPESATDEPLQKIHQDIHDQDWW